MIGPSRLRFSLCLLAPLCAAPPGYWAKPGVEPPAAQHAYAQCLAEAHEAIESDREIDRDILATRSNDWQRAGTLGVETRIMHSDDRARADSVLARCMRDRGYRWVAKSPVG